jgi:hypothetical protein
MWIGDARDKLIQLAEAMPESKHNGTPEKGVRTVGEVFPALVGPAAGRRSQVEEVTTR